MEGLLLWYSEKEGFSVFGLLLIYGTRYDLFFDFGVFAFGVIVGAEDRPDTKTRRPTAVFGKLNCRVLVNCRFLVH